MTQLRFRSIWISDLHLGTRNIQHRQLLDFLNNTYSDYLYLVGDILDLMYAKRGWHWSRINDEIVHTIMDRASNGTKVYYIPGNHDAMLRKFHGESIRNIHIRNQMVHETVRGQRYLILHGDEFDCVIQNSPWLAYVGSILYDSLLMMNRWVNKTCTACGLEYRSFSLWMKHKTKAAVNYIGSFEKAVVKDVQEKKLDGLICGHIHDAAIKSFGDILYLNSGDWVESCTALAENMDGTIGIIDWTKLSNLGELPVYETSKDMYSNGCLAPSN